MRGIEDVYKARADKQLEQKEINREEWIRALQKKPRVEKSSGERRKAPNLYYRR